MVPDFATHYYLPSRGPFRSLTQLPDEDAVNVMRGLEEERRLGNHHRRFGRTYLDMRRETERRLRHGLIAAGGDPEQGYPHYLVLGESTWFRELARGMAELRVAVTELPPTATSLTYGDSFYATGVSGEYGFGPAPAVGHSRVYRLEDLSGLVDALGVPEDQAEDDYEGYEHRSVARFIELQVWTDLARR